MNIRVRFAPSPTGSIHIGNTRTALLNYLYAKKNKGTFILRIEDTDQQRNVEGSEERLIEDLEWLGIVEDEGTVKGGDCAPYRDSEIIATGIYEEIIEKLKSEDHIYECFVTPDELEMMKKIQKSQNKPPRYDNRHRDLTEEQKEAFRAEGRSSVLRLKLPEKNIEWEDMVRGHVKFNTANLGGDPVMVRSNGIPVFALANVINDELHKVNFVIRGEDHTANTATQIVIYDALGYTKPTFAHTTMLMDTDGTKLSKRLGSLGIRDLKEQGYLPQAITGFMASIGMGSDQPVAADIETLAQNFDLSKISRNAPKFDIEQVKRLNGIYLKTLSFDEVKPYLCGFLPACFCSCEESDKLELFWETVKHNINLLSELEAAFNICFKEKGDAILEDEDKDFIKQALESLPKEITEDSWKEWTTALKESTGRKGKQLFMPLRIALLGVEHGPEMAKMLVLLGRENAIERMQNSIK